MQKKIEPTVKNNRAKSEECSQACEGIKNSQSVYLGWKSHICSTIASYMYILDNFSKYPPANSLNALFCRLLLSKNF